MKIRWNTDVNAPCPGEIVQLRKDGRPTGRTVLVQTDWDFPGTARSFGWDMTRLQRWACPSCGEFNVDNSASTARPLCSGCGWDFDWLQLEECGHSGTDGTVDCECGLTVTDFISAAYDWLMEHDGVVVEDPGYF